MLLCVAAELGYAQQFRISVNVEGMPEGATVRLAPDNNRRNIIATDVVRNGSAVLTGRADSLVIAELSIDDKVSYGEGEYPMPRGLTFMLSDTVISFTAPSFMSVPRIYELGSSPVVNEMNVTISGGAVQRNYEQWRRDTHDKRLALWQAGNDLWRLNYGPDARRRNTLNQEELAERDEKEAMLKKIVDERTAETEEFSRNYMASHPTFASSLLTATALLKNPFRHTSEEIDALVAQLKGNEDVRGYQRLCAMAATAKRTPRNSALTDFKVERPDGSQTTLKDAVKAAMGEGCKAVLVDFWASWCGPCRAAVPKVKELHKASGDKIAIISISLDKKQDDWHKAMTEEQMPWMQLCAPASEMKTLAESYSLLSIPTVLIVSPDGRVLFSTHNMDEAQRFVTLHSNPLTTNP